MKRRTALSAISAGLLGAGALALRPRDAGAPHAAYFARTAAALSDAGIATPAMVLDRGRMLANAAQVTRNIGGRMQLRLVAKSLPSLPLLDDLAAATGTQRLMVFNLPYLQTLATERPRTELLLGKPMPVAAAAGFYDRPAGSFDPTRQLQWLIDTPERMVQYRDLARQRQLTMRISLEIDVGLHRGGASNAQMLQHMLDILKSEPRLLWSGMMGYDAHIAKLPGVPGLRTRALGDALAIYRDYVAQATRNLGTPAGLTLNTGGSPTYRLHDGTGAANELAIGSALVKPGDFDTSLLADLLPAAFIATPVLKVLPRFDMPNGAEWIGTLARAWDVNQSGAFFIYGGNWLADPVSPAGLAPSGLYGTSSNQQMLLGSGAQGLHVDDYVFFRPRQSESVLQQFGDIVVMESGRITQRWPVLPAVP